MHFSPDRFASKGEGHDPESHILVYARKADWVNLYPSLFVDLTHDTILRRLI